MVKGRPDAGDHEVDALAADPGLDAVPDAVVVSLVSCRMI